MDVTLIARDAREPVSRIRGCSTARRYLRPNGRCRICAPRWAGADLAAPPVVLPDFHHKSNMELPSSVAVATAQFHPAHADQRLSQLRHGADRARTPTGRTRAGIEEFYRRVRERFPYPPGRAARAVRPGRAELRGRRRRVRGASGSAQPESILQRVEEFGALDLERWGGADRLRRSSRPWCCSWRG